MPPWLPELIVVVVQIVATIALYPAVRWQGAARAMAFGIAFVIVMIGPFAVDPNQRGMRLAAALAAAWMSTKVYEIYHGMSPAERPGFGGYVSYVFNPL